MAMKKKSGSEYGSYGKNDVSGMGVAGRAVGGAPYTSYGRTAKRAIDQAKRTAAKKTARANTAQSARMTAQAKAAKKKK